jgi:hypothetical protein
VDIIELVNDHIQLLQVDSNSCRQSRRGVKGPLLVVPNCGAGKPPKIRLTDCKLLCRRWRSFAGTFFPGTEKSAPYHEG